MAAPKTTYWKLDRHTRAKHSILRTYLNAWLPMLLTYNTKILYIDGFAGPGKYEGGEEGSPIIALKAALDHPSFKKLKKKIEIRFLFVEERKDRADALKQEISNLNKKSSLPPWITQSVECCEFAPLMGKILDEIEKQHFALAPTFIFIDPFGFSGVPMELIARIAKNPQCECLITFMFEAINRFISHPEDKIKTHFDELFGTEAWREIVTTDLTVEKKEAILKLYHNQLIQKAGFKYIRSFEMRDSGNRTEYFLFFGTNHPKGLSKMKEAMWKVDSMSGDKFSDRTDPNQIILFELEPNLTRLEKLLQDKFRGKGWIPIKDISNFVLFETPYCEEKHLKKKTLKPMEISDPPKISVRQDNKKRREGTYPEGAVIKFL